MSPARDTETTVTYAINGFRARIRMRDNAPVQYFDGFFGRESVGEDLVDLPPLELEPFDRPAAADWKLSIDGGLVSASCGEGGIAVWSDSASRFQVWTGARRLLRDVWLERRITGPNVSFVHSSAVDDGRDLVIFVGDKRAGKTSLMLDATINHGWRMVANDCLVVVDDARGPAASGVPTYMGIRQDVARRFEDDIRARIASDRANRESYGRWLSAVPANAEHKLYLSPGALGGPVCPTIPLRQRRVTVVAVGFAAPEAMADVRPPAVELARFLPANQKPMAYMFQELGLRPAGPLPVDPLLLARLCRGVRFVAYRHHGRADRILQYVRG
ncbi:hypothetical protein [Dactylosporangium sp. CA-139066]|uniref:hypothetical protein n=1 Tax=Dactylosporangium sp. CA-139066 TaxID=3239930 RepID=UPI003D94E644